MSGRFVRSSKYRHVFGQPTRREQCYDNLRVSANAWDTNLLKVNPQYLAVNWETGGGGAFAVIPLEERGKLPERIPLFRGHTAAVLDTDWNPFNDSLIASGSDDGKIFLWRVPDNFTVRPDVEPDNVQDISPVGKLSGHSRKVGQVLFNPAAENVLATASGDFSIKIWDIEAGATKFTLKLGDSIQSQSWSANGSLLVTTSRDKKLRIWDVRQERPAVETAGHSGAKNSRAVWMGEHDRIATTGFSRMSDRQLALWDVRAAREPISGFKTLDSISGVCVPFWDDGTQCLYLAGKGDGNIRYYEFQNDKFEYLTEYKSGDPQRGLAFMPKRGVNIHQNEVVRIYKSVSDTYIEPISFIVPRRSENFQDDIYPPAIGITPAMTSSEWINGKEAIPPKISLESLFEGTGLKEVTPSQEKPTSTITASAPQPAEPAKPAKQAEPVRAEPTPVVRPAPSMKDQGASMSAMVDKFADNEEKDDVDDTSSFEEVARPVEQAPPSPVKTTPPVKEEPVKQTITPVASTPTTATPKVSQSPPESSGSVKDDIAEIKALIAQQTKTIASQAEQVKYLTAEIESLKSKLDN
ncbi:putative actin-binding protein [Talaromyces proteolyticus]|uniref:Coronin n=1 Tax=Talaromyces proteolyticus TaxID=1131652 RepID=A0AAD4KK14_9EURO|nr:putative actin-binding protein [Talaromyces proteolyticus]KAH8690241.1 putative actin-binding protein [Talaromyces proteolyticus]